MEGRVAWWVAGRPGMLPVLSTAEIQGSARRCWQASPSRAFGRDACEEATGSSWGLVLGGCGDLLGFGYGFAEVVHGGDGVRAKAVVPDRAPYGW